MMRVSTGRHLIPKLLSVVADGSSAKNLYRQSFTDDFGFLIIGTFSSTVSELMQRTSCMV
jgi:uncharacterized protein CbrC (UPF0167 family)